MARQKETVAGDGTAAGHAQAPSLVQRRRAHGRRWRMEGQLQMMDGGAACDGMQLNLYLLRQLIIILH